MKHNPKFIYPKSIRSLINDKRHYEIGTAKLPSVTTILAATMPEEKRKSLDAWKQRVGATEAQKVVTTAANRGTSLHSIVEGFLRGERHLDLTETGTIAHRMANVLIEKGLKNRVTDIWGIEPTVFYEKLYAGATDFIGIHDGIPIIGDHKNSNKPKKEIWLRDSYRLQVAAYALAFEDMFGEHISKGVNFIITPDCYYQEFSWDGEDFRQAKYEWLRRVDQYYNQKQSLDK